MRTLASGESGGSERKARATVVGEEVNGGGVGGVGMAVSGLAVLFPASQHLNLTGLEDLSGLFSYLAV